MDDEIWVAFLKEQDLYDNDINKILLEHYTKWLEDKGYLADDVCVPGVTGKDPKGSVAVTPNIADDLKDDGQLNDSSG
jgi:hypothetical protein